MTTIAFKPYACGTMTQPYIDCAIALAQRGVDAERHRQHHLRGRRRHRAPPLGAARHPSTSPPPRTPPSSARPFCMAVGFLDGRAGFQQFTEARIHDPAVLALAAKISYVIDPDNPYPNNFTGHLLATLHDGTVHEVRQDHMRGGAARPADARRSWRPSSSTTCTLRRLDRNRRAAACSTPSPTSSRRPRSRSCRSSAHEGAGEPRRRRHRRRRQYRPRHRPRPGPRRRQDRHQRPHLGRRGGRHRRRHPRRGRRSHRPPRRRHRGGRLATP